MFADWQLSGQDFERVQSTNLELFSAVNSVYNAVSAGFKGMTWNDAGSMELTRTVSVDVGEEGFSPTYAKAKLR